jgi:hypothetical protein
MGMYRIEWDCCGSVTETDAWTPEECPFCKEYIPVSVEAAVLAEREACAEVCDRFAENEAGFVAEDCAAAIRARGEK